MRKHRADLVILILTVILMAIGLVVIYAIGPRVAQFENSQNDSHFGDFYFFGHHAMTVGISVAALIIGWLVKHEFLAKFAKKMLIASIIMCVIVWILGKAGATSIVTCDEGACRAFRIPGIGVGFQPAEFFKIAVLFYVPWLIKDRKERGLLDKSEFMIPLAALMGAIAVFVGILLKDFGSTVVMIFMIFAMMLAGGVSWKVIGYFLAGIAVAFLVLIVTQPHRVQRIMGFTEDGEDGWHLENSLIGMGTGGMFGVGLGNSIQSTGYLPEALSDSIFAIIGESWGLIGALCVLVILAALMIRILGVGKKTADKEQCLFVIGVFAWLGAHVIINVGGMTGIIPMKGITLPFLSYGGTSMLFISYAVGVVLQISGWTKREVIKEEDENTSSRRGQRGPRYAGSRRRA